MNLQVAQRILQVALSLCLDLLSGVTVLAINALYNFEHLQFLGNKNQNLGKNCSTLLLSYISVEVKNVPESRYGVNK